MDEEMGRRKGGVGHPGTRERHPFAHQLFFLLSRPGGRKRPPLSLWDPSLSSPPPTPTPTLPPCESSVNGEPHSLWMNGMGWIWVGGNSDHHSPPMPEPHVQHITIWSLVTAEGCFILPNWTHSQMHLGSLGQVWCCFYQPPKPLSLNAHQCELWLRRSPTIVTEDIHQ